MRTRPRRRARDRKGTQERSWKTDEEEREADGDIKEELLFADVQGTRGVPRMCNMRVYTTGEKEEKKEGEGKYRNFRERVIFRSGGHAITRVVDSLSRKAARRFDK
ncbi:unnamed protein product [Lasius platythorax]|uniref:Uncharacterized protein n=1 Tax=Lasius platythorax TaxID=488582 RepID=A0AAV2N4C8_9HYME